jgi:hypothetical protein
VHLVLFWPLDPIVLVEGKFDREFIEEAFRFSKPKRAVRVVDLPKLDGSVGGSGVERIQRYVKDNAAAIRSRRPTAPIIVVLDWDAAGKVEQFKKYVGDNSVYKVLSWPEKDANPKAGRSFKGIERFHSSRVLDLAISRGTPIGRKMLNGRPGDYIVAASEYDEVKIALAEIVRAGLQSTDFIHADDFIKQILHEAAAL